MRPDQARAKNNRRGEAEPWIKPLIVESHGVTYSEPFDPEARARSYLYSAVLSRHHSYQLCDEEIAAELGISIGEVQLILTSRYAEAWHAGVYNGARLYESGSHAYHALARACLAEGADIADVARVFDTRERDVVKLLRLDMLTTAEKWAAAKAEKSLKQEEVSMLEVPQPRIKMLEVVS